MEKHFNIIAKENRLLGQMTFCKEVVNDIINTHIEQLFYNNLRIIDIQTDTNGNVNKYRLEYSEWPNERICHRFSYYDRINGYIDESDSSKIYLDKQLVFESFYIVPEIFIKESNGIIRIFDFIKSMHTKILFRTEVNENYNCIQITAPVCIKITLDKKNLLIKYEDINSQISYIEV